MVPLGILVAGVADRKAAQERGGGRGVVLAVDAQERRPGARAWTETRWKTGNSLWQGSHHEAQLLTTTGMAAQRCAGARESVPSPPPSSWLAWACSAASGAGEPWSSALSCAVARGGAARLAGAAAGERRMASRSDTAAAEHEPQIATGRC